MSIPFDESIHQQATRVIASSSAFRVVAVPTAPSAVSVPPIVDSSTQQQPTLTGGDHASHHAVHASTEAFQTEKETKQIDVYAVLGPIVEDICKVLELLDDENERERELEYHKQALLELRAKAVAMVQRKQLSLQKGRIVSPNKENDLEYYIQALLKLLTRAVAMVQSKQKDGLFLRTKKSSKKRKTYENNSFAA